MSEGSVEDLDAVGVEHVEVGARFGGFLLGKLTGARQEKPVVRLSNRFEDGEPSDRVAVPIEGP